MGFLSLIFAGLTPVIVVITIIIIIFMIMAAIGVGITIWVVLANKQKKDSANADIQNNLMVSCTKAGGIWNGSSCLDQSGKPVIFSSFSMSRKY